jgi:DNA-binding NarL/FixJ family response regulator
VARIRVVVADDVDRIRALLRDLLEQDGRFSVVGEAADGLEAVSVAERERPDALVLDLCMPAMDGLEALPLIRDRSPETNVVVMSSYDARDMSLRAFQAGAAAYVEKGESVSTLASTLLTVCGARRLREATTVPALRGA